MDPIEMRAIIREELQPLIDAVQAVPPVFPDTMTAQELATALRCSVQQVHLMARQGEIPSIRVGRSRRFIPADVREALRPKPVDLWAPRSRKKVRRWSPQS